MAHWQLSEKDEAHKCYDRALDWMANNKCEGEELGRFRAEAAKLLGIPGVSPVEQKRTEDAAPADQAAPPPEEKPND